ncbi:MAG TPA: hypothetical protein VF692_06620 [Pyrinomonadaceae bacterium]
MNDDKEVTVSPSRPLIGSTDAVSENAEREADYKKTLFWQVDRLDRRLCILYKIGKHNRIKLKRLIDLSEKRVMRRNVAAFGVPFQ